MAALTPGLGMSADKVKARPMDMVKCGAGLLCERAAVVTVSTGTALHVGELCFPRREAPIMCIVVALLAVLFRTMKQARRARSWNLMAAVTSRFQVFARKRQCRVRMPGNTERMG